MNAIEAIKELIKDKEDDLNTKINYSDYHHREFKKYESEAIQLKELVADLKSTLLYLEQSEQEWNGN